MVEMSLQQQKEVRDQLSTLFEQPGWKWMQEVLQNQLNVRVQNLILQSAGRVDDIVGLLQLKGECTGLKLAIELPQLSLRTLEEQIELEVHDARQKETEYGSE